ncbi:MAG TPA: LssY C-terminal domain-containing protein [Terriglobales bacterium]
MLKLSTRGTSAYAALIVFLALSVSAQEVKDNAAQLTIPDGTPIELRLVESVSSNHAHKGNRLNFIVVKDVNLDGYTLVPAGTTAHGTITEVKGKRFLGIGARISFRVDSVELAGGETLKLQASKVVKGGSRTKLMAGAMIASSIIFLPATPVFLLTRGRESTVVKSTEITAQVQGPASVQVAGLSRSAANASGLAEMMDYLPPRVFSGEGREGDMVNLIFVAQQKELQDAFEHAGWVQTDNWKPIFVWHLMRHGTSDAHVPMARFYLFGRVQDYSYALPDPQAIVSRRHHLRIWKTDFTQNGTPIWVGSATHDVAIEIAKNGRLINHRIDPQVDEERDFIGGDLTQTASVSSQQYLHGVSPVFEAKTASGEAYHSDSRILLLDLKTVPAQAQTPAQGATLVRANSVPPSITSGTPPAAGLR